MQILTIALINKNKQKFQYSLFKHTFKTTYDNIMTEKISWYLPKSADR